MHSNINTSKREMINNEMEYNIKSQNKGFSKITCYVTNIQSTSHAC